MIQHLRQWWTLHAVWVFAAFNFLSPSLAEWSRNHPKTLLAGIIPLVITAIVTKAPADRPISHVLALMLLPALFLSGCTPLEVTAYRTAVGAHAFIKSIAAEHPECTVSGNTVRLCAILERARAAKDALIDATEVYCGGPRFDAGGPCEPPKKGTPAEQQVTAKLREALSIYGQAASDLKGAIQ